MWVRLLHLRLKSAPREREEQRGEGTESICSVCGDPQEKIMGISTPNGVVDFWWSAFLPRLFCVVVKKRVSISFPLPPFLAGAGPNITSINLLGLFMFYSKSQAIGSNLLQYWLNHRAHPPFMISRAKTIDEYNAPKVPQSHQDHLSNLYQISYVWVHLVFGLLEYRKRSHIIM